MAAARGDYRHAKADLGWEAHTAFKALIELMIEVGYAPAGGADLE